MYDKELAEYAIWMSEEKRKKKEDLEKRMSDSYAKRQRKKKITKLMAMDSHWKGLS
tara:strand:+ start:68 stop:235 length:168 start_codon:yes stop_codon:yes gene_type:complete